VKLISLTLSQFKGIDQITLLADGADLSVHGDNATGKTTLADGFFWLLFGKDSLGRADFSLKPIDVAGTSVPGTEPTAEAVLMMEDGTRLTLKKVNKEDWATKRGSLEREYKGTKTDYFINTVPVLKKDFEARIESICSEKLFRILTDPTHFSEGLHWKDRREMLLKMCGDVSVAEVCAAHPELSGLPEILGEHSVEEYRKININTRGTVKKEIESIPVRINEVQRSLDQMGKESFDEAKAQALDVDLQKLLTQKAGMLSTGLKAQKFTELSNLKVQHTQIISRLQSAAQAGYREALHRLRTIKVQEADLQSELEKKSSQISTAELQVVALKGEIDVLRDEWSKIQHREFEEPTLDGSCPTCGQALPSDEIQQKRDEMLEKFNLKKAQDLEANSTSGKAKAETLKIRQDQIAEAKAKVASITEQLETVQADLAEASKLEESVRNPEIDQNHPDLLEASQKIKALEKELDEMAEDEQADFTEIDQKIKDARAALEAEQAKKATESARKISENRLKLLKQDEKRLAEEHQKLEAHFYLTEQFIRAKVSALTSKINSHFILTSFKLFDEQVNGGIAECCEATCEGVPFSSLNNGRRVNVGLDIISSLSHHFGFKPPIFIDNAESVTSIFPTPEQQQIRLIVSAADQKLRPISHTTAGVN